MVGHYFIRYAKRFKTVLFGNFKQQLLESSRTRFNQNFLAVAPRKRPNQVVIDTCTARKCRCYIDAMRIVLGILIHT